MSKHEASMEKINYYLTKQNNGKRLTTADQIDLVHEFCVSTMAHKLLGLSAISTCHWNCEFCKKMAKNPETICFKCYVDKETYKVNLIRALERNTLMLNNIEFSKTALKHLVLPTEIVRFQAHGETENPTCARNFLRIAESHKANRFGYWEKNDWAVTPALEELGKPRNLKVLHSSLFINKVGLPIPRLAPYVDHVFTVIDKRNETFEYNCARKCHGCEKCYKPCRVRKDSAKYCAYKAQVEEMGLEYRGHDYYIFEELR